MSPALLAKSLYDRDLDLWVLETINQLKARNFELVDLENLIEELAGLSGRDRRELESRIATLLEHLLKRCYVPSPYDYNGWQETIERTRFEISRILKQSPSLRRYAEQPELFTELYAFALRILRKNSDYKNVLFPNESQFGQSLADLLTVNFWEKDQGKNYQLPNS